MSESEIFNHPHNAAPQKTPKRPTPAQSTKHASQFRCVGRGGVRRVVALVNGAWGGGGGCELQAPWKEEGAGGREGETGTKGEQAGRSGQQETHANTHPGFYDDV